MKYDQVYYTSSTTGIRGGAGFQINAHSGKLEPDIARELEAYSLYTPPTECPRTPDTAEELASFPVSYRYRLFGGRRAGLSRSVYLGKDYNSVRYGNFFTHTLLAPEELKLSHWQGPLQMAKMGVWADKASENTEIPSLELNLETALVETKAHFNAWQHPRFIDLISFALAGLTDRKTTVIVDGNYSPDQWISALLCALPAKIRPKLSFSTYEYNPQNIDYNLCGTRHDTGFDFSEASFRFNFYILDFEQNRFSDSLEHKHFARIAARLASNSSGAGLSSLLAFIDSIEGKLDLAKLDSLAELWYMLYEDQDGNSLLRALKIMQDFAYKPAAEILLALQKRISSLNPMNAVELQKLWLYIYDGFIISAQENQNRLMWAHSLFIIMIKSYPNAESAKIHKLVNIIQESGGLTQMDNLEILIDEFEQILTQGEHGFISILQVLKDLDLEKHSRLQAHLKPALMLQLSSFTADETSVGFVANSLATHCSYVERALIELFAQRDRGAIFNDFLGKLLMRADTNRYLTDLIDQDSRNELKELLVIYKLFSDINWEAAAKTWWNTKRSLRNESGLQDTFWNTAHNQRPQWAPLSFLETDPQLIVYPSYHHAFWQMMKTRPKNDKNTLNLMEKLEHWIHTHEQFGDLCKDTQDIGQFITAFRSVFYKSSNEAREVTKILLSSIPLAYAEYEQSLVLQLIERFCSQDLKTSEWESIISSIHKATPRALTSCLSRQLTFPAFFWVALLSFASSNSYLLSEELKEQIKETVKGLSETELKDINDMLRYKPAVAEYLQSLQKGSVLQNTLAFIKRILKGKNK